jgi:uncharacterized membrane protein
MRGAVVLHQYMFLGAKQLRSDRCSSHRTHSRCPPAIEHDSATSVGVDLRVMVALFDQQELGCVANCTYTVVMNPVLVSVRVAQIQRVKTLPETSTVFLSRSLPSTVTVLVSVSYSAKVSRAHGRWSRPDSIPNGSPYQSQR